MNRETKKQYRRDILTIIALLSAVVLITRLWPILLLMIIGLFAYALWMLFRVERKPEPVEPPVLLSLPAPATEETILSNAFGLLQRRITEQVVAVHPDARWVWDVTDAKGRFAAGEPLFILLNRAGGYRKAVVRVNNLQFLGLALVVTEQQKAAQQESTAETQKEQPSTEPESVDYGLLAFEWVEANLQELNGHCNEVIGRGEESFRILAADLPHADSWHDICKELLRNGFTSAEPLADGIEVQIKTK